MCLFYIQTLSYVHVLLLMWAFVLKNNLLTIIQYHSLDQTLYWIFPQLHLNIPKLSYSIRCFIWCYDSILIVLHVLATNAYRPRSMSTQEWHFVKLSHKVKYAITYSRQVKDIPHKTNKITHATRQCTNKKEKKHGTCEKQWQSLVTKW